MLAKRSTLNLNDADGLEEAGSAKILDILAHQPIVDVENIESNKMKETLQFQDKSTSRTPSDNQTELTDYVRA